MLTRIGDLSAVFIGYDEPEREAHWQDLRAKLPRVVRVEGVKGLVSAFQAAAEAASTERFLTIDADCRIDADFCHHPVADDALDSNKVLSWPTRNVVNGLVYGNGGIKCWTRGMLRSARVTDGEHLDHALTFGYIFEGRPFGTCHPNGSPLQAFRSGFREGVRLGLVKGAPPGLDRMVGELPPNNLRRMLTWCSVGADVHLGLWCIWGAREGCLKAQAGGVDRGLIGDYDRFDAFFAQEFAPRGDTIDAALRASGERLRAAGLAVEELGPRQSAFLREHLTSAVDLVAFDMQGNLYRTGQADLPRDPEKAFEAYLTGALLGSGNALNNVARCYREGDGIAADAVQATNWLLHAAALENPWALLRLGRTAARDGQLDAARHWLGRAARAGSSDAEKALAALDSRSPPRSSSNAA